MVEVPSFATLPHYRFKNGAKLSPPPHVQTRFMSPVYSRYWVHTTLDRTQWAVPFNMNDFKREEIDIEVTLKNA